ncbi:hypothetical protein [Paenarthrobacter sp. DKR-5]|uniref:hypothetical protein n=1 Tax=Paenarthrobacter sp. DKR-5 TaxID=2835535 RepID=UPI0025439204|nr:hypothetical protein [Paenarthrobacter sp. DKR-5]
MSPPAPGTSITATLRRRRGLTGQAAVAAVDQACRRLRVSEWNRPARWLIIRCRWG